MEGIDDRDVPLTPLLLFSGQSKFNEQQTELLPFPDGRLAFEHALETIHSAVPTAKTIYISLHEESQLAAIKFRLDEPESSAKTSPQAHPSDHDHEDIPFPSLKSILDDPKYGSIRPAASLLTAHALHPNATLLVIGCAYPLLPASAVLQLVLEYRRPLTCFVTQQGLSIPLVAIWSPEALEELSMNVDEGNLNRVVERVNGKLIRPLRDKWITECNTTEEWHRELEILNGDLA